MRFEAHMRDVDAVLECFAVGGKFDYFIKSAFPTIQDYQAFMDGLLASNLGVEQYFTIICTKAVKTASWTPLRSLLSNRADLSE